MVSDLLTSFLRVIREQYRSQLRSLMIPAAIEEEGEELTDRKANHSLPDLGSVQLNSIAAFFLQTCEEEGLFSSLFAQTMTYLKELFQYTIIPSRGQANDGGVHHVILSEGKDH